MRVKGRVANRDKARGERQYPMLLTLCLLVVVLATLVLAGTATAAPSAAGKYPGVLKNAEGSSWPLTGPSSRALPLEAARLAPAGGVWNSVHAAGTGSISGRVTRSSGMALAFVEVFLLDAEFNLVDYTFADLDGYYGFDGLPNISILVGVFAESNYSGGETYIDEWYNNVTMPGNYEAIGATWLNLATTVSRTGINFSLARGKYITGKVRDGDSNLLPNISVDAYDLNGNYMNSGVTYYGDYLIPGLPAGQYKIVTATEGDYVDEWYNNDPVLLDLDGVHATVIDVRTASASGKDFQLASAHGISGKVTASTLIGLADVEVLLMPAGGDSFVSARTDETGSYDFKGLIPGQYLLATANDQGYVDEWYLNDPVPGDMEGTAATPVDISSSDANGIDFVLDQGCTISGAVLEQPANVPLTGPGMVVSTYNAEGKLVAENLVGGPSGDIGYTTWALPSDTTYYAKAVDYAYGDYSEAWYNNKPASQFDLADATAIPVATSDVTGINFGLYRMNVTDQTSGYIKYTGTYTPYSSTSAHGGSYTRLSGSGSAATVYFSGVRLDWIAMKGTTTGPAKVYVDDVLKGTVDLTATTVTYKVKVWSTGDLPRGPHKVKIEWNATTGKYVTIDAVQVDGVITDAVPMITAVTPRTGSTLGGTAVTITGSGLLGASSVTFGGTPASGVSVNSAGTQLTCSTPAHSAGTVQVQVTTPAGSTADTAADDFTYTEVPPVTRYDITTLTTNLVKTGTWADYTSAGSYKGSYARASTSSATATIWFKGTQIVYVAFKGTTAGYADVYIDNVKQTTVNLTATAVAYQQTVWTSPVLSNGLHSFKVVRNNSLSPSGKFVTLDAVDITGEIAAPPTRYEQSNTSIHKTIGTWADFSNTTASNGSYGRSLTADATATIHFTGTRIDYIGFKGTTTGWVDIYLDGELKATIDLGATTTVGNQLIWSSGTVDASVPHTFYIHRNGTHSLATEYLTLDAVDIWGAIAP